MCARGKEQPLDIVAELPDTQTSHVTTNKREGGLLEWNKFKTSFLSIVIHAFELRSAQNLYVNESSQGNKFMFHSQVSHQVGN